jgi:hypothetical protein
MRERPTIIVHDPFKHLDGRQPGQVRPSRCRRKRQAQPNEVMRRIPDHGLIEITNLNLDFPPGVSDRAKIAHVAIAANPDRRPLGKRSAFHTLEPLVIANRIAPHVSVRGSGHLAVANFFQKGRASIGTGNTLFVFHDWSFALDIAAAGRLGWPRRHLHPRQPTPPSKWRPSCRPCSPRFASAAFRLLESFVQQGGGLVHVELTRPRN